MKEKLISALGNKLDEFNAFVDSVKIVEEDNTKILEVVIDRENDFIDLKTIVKITRIINPIVDSLGLSDGVDTLDIYAKEKGDNYE